MKMARIAILRDSRALEQKWNYGLNEFGLYLGEVLTHAGIPFEWIDELHHTLENGYDLVLIASAPSHEAANDTLWLFAERGGVVVAYGSLNGLARRIGYAPTEPLAVGYATLDEGETPLRFHHAAPWMPQKPEALQCEASGSISRAPEDPPAGAALQRFAIGAGWLDRWAVDIPATIVGLQQGLAPVAEDGAPGPDGSSNLYDGVLKAEDGLTMDWEHDRLQTAAGSPYFAYPYADLWREAIVAHVLRRTAERHKPLPFADYWPEGVAQVAMLSHDSDRNFDEDAVATMDALREAGIRSTWCMMKPGYSQRFYEKIAGAGHELALHYNANLNEGGRWEEADFIRQFAWLREIVQGPVTSNKNHFTRFEGWGELFRWCEACGVEADQTRGPSKRGDAGFLFGTCHPYRPIAWANERNRLYDVLEIGFLTQDLPQFTDTGVIVPFLEQAARVRGVAHFLFHQGRIQSAPEVRAALLETVRAAKARRFTFWTCRQINDWQRARRRLRSLGLDDEGRVLLPSEDEADAGQEAAFWRPLLAGETAEPGAIVEQRFGVPCLKLKRG